MTTIERFLNALREHGQEPRRSGLGWACTCPAHPDTSPSLSISSGDDGRVLLNCHAGCTVDAVCVALGLQLSDLFPDDPSKRNGHAPKLRPPIAITTTPRNTASREVPVIGPTFATANEAVKYLESRYGPKSKSKTPRGPKSDHWKYYNPEGEPVGLVVRWDTPADPTDPASKPSKDIQPVSRMADGRWANKGMAEPRPLYRLPELLATAPSSRVYVCEGEKATDAARACGLATTTSPHGSQSAGKADWSPMAGREVVIMPDHDDAGEKYAADVSRLSLAAGAKSVRVIRLAELWPAMPVGGDIVDFLKHRGGDIDTTRADLEALVGNTEREEAIEPLATADLSFKPFPTDTLPEPIRGFVIEAAKAIGCDESYIALPLISALASAVGNTRRIQLKRGWTEPSIIWTAIIGESGTMKTPAFKLAMKFVRKAQTDAFKEHGAAMKEWEGDNLLYEADLTGWKRKAANGKDAGEPPEKPAPPTARRYVVNDTTTQALAPILQANPRGVLLARDELSGWLGSFDQYSKGGGGGADSAAWLSMHGGESLTVDRKGGIPPVLHVPMASVSITGGIQPGILARSMGREHHESGMMARVLFAMPPRRPKRWTEDEGDPSTETAVAAVFDKLFALTMEADDDGNERPRLVMLSAGGKRAWVEYVNDLGLEAVELSGDLAAAWSKLEGYGSRLAIVIHLARRAAGDLTLADPERVDEVSVAAGVKLARWFGDEAKRVYAGLAETDDDRDTRRLVELIQRKGGDVSARELVQSSRDFPTVADAEAAMTALEAAGKGKCSIPGQRGPGRPKARRFTLAPVYGVYVYGIPAGGTKNTNTVDVDNVDKPTATVGGTDGIDDGWGEVKG